MITLFKRLSFAAACTLAMMIGAATSANAMLPVPPGGAGRPEGGTGVGTARHVLNEAIASTVPWHLLVLTVAVSVLLAVAFAATFTVVHARHATRPNQA